MNAKDRKEVSAIVSELEGLQARLQELADAEQEKFDNMSEGLQAGERGQAIETAAGELSSAADAVQEALDALGNLES